MSFADTTIKKAPSTADIKAATKGMKGHSANPKGELGKKDFLKLLLTELKHQDPTAPVETDKILSQTSQLASLEASQNTNDSLGNLSSALRSSLQFTTVSAIGKIADTGNDEVLLKENKSVSFEIYVPKDIAAGSIEIKDTLGNVVKAIPVSSLKKGTHSFSWNGENADGLRAKEGSYHVRMSYGMKNGQGGETGVGVYPITTVRFDDGKTLMKLGSKYVPFKAIKEVYEASDS